MKDFILLVMAAVLLILCLTLRQVEYMLRDKLFQKCRGRRRVYTENTEHTPNRDDVSAAILQHLDGLRGIDTHCHHLPDDQFQNMGVKFLYDQSYCNWMDDLLGLLHSYSNVYADLCWQWQDGKAVAYSYIG